MTHKLTPELVKGLFGFMCSSYHSKVVAKDGSAAMKAAGWALSLMRIEDQNEFLNDFSTTLGRTIYIPYVPGEACDGWPLEHQIASIVHEHLHVEQYNAGGWTWQWNYLTNPTKRAGYEAEAYATELETYYWYNKSHLDVHELASVLYSYGCSSADVAVTEAHLKACSAIAWAGGVIHAPSQKAIAWLNAHVPS